MLKNKYIKQESRVSTNVLWSEQNLTRDPVLKGNVSRYFQ